MNQWLSCCSTRRPRRGQGLVLLQVLVLLLWLLLALARMAVTKLTRRSGLCAAHPGTPRSTGILHRLRPSVGVTSAPCRSRAGHPGMAMSSGRRAGHPGPVAGSRNGHGCDPRRVHRCCLRSQRRQPSLRAQASGPTGPAGSEGPLGSTWENKAMQQARQVGVRVLD